MDEIAAGAGITKPMLYAYFESKEGLYIACIERAGRPLIEAVRAAVDPELPPDRQLWAGIRAHFEFVERHRDDWATFFLQASARGGAAAVQVQRVRREMSDILTDLLTRTARAEGLATEQLPAGIQVEAIALQGATEAMSAWWLEHPEVPRDLMALRLMNFAWQGFDDLLRGRLWLPPPDS
jgi:AcrR family transcriptional regulator